MTHPIEAAIAGLVSVWRSAPELLYDVDGVQVQLLVTDDPLLDDTESRRLLLVGTGAQYLPGGAQGNTGYDLAGQRVQIDVVCELHVWSGATDAPGERRQALDVIDVLDVVLARDRTLGGQVDWPRITRTTYQPGENDQGATAIVEFTVRVDATRAHPQ